jgi:hypothetical protein
MRGAPQMGFARCIWRISVRMSTAIGGATETGLRATPAPGQHAAMPRHDGGGFHDLHGLPPAAPDSGEQHPKESVGSIEVKPSRRGPLEDGELMSESQDLRFEFGPRPETGPNRRKKGCGTWAHDW